MVLVKNKKSKRKRQGSSEGSKRNEKDRSEEFEG